jgi:hypothetical protein
MSRIDDVIITVPTMTEAKRAIWSTNATRVIANGPRASFRGFDGDRLIARVIRIKRGKITAQLRRGE